MIRRLRRLVRIAGFAVFIAAVSQEMAKSEPDRTWSGKVWGFIPYDFRPPTWQRLRDAYWNPDDPRVFTERVYGVGWAINLYRAKQYMTATYASLMGGKLPAAQRWTQRTAKVRSSAKAAGSS